MITPPRDRRNFKQARSRATYEGLIAAGTELFASVGYEATQTPDIAARAGVSTGAFYRYFTDKHEIFLEVLRYHLEHEHAETMRHIEASVPGAADPRTALTGVVAHIFSRIRKNGALERVFTGMAFADEDVARLRAEFVAARTNHVAALVRALVPPEIAPNPVATAHVIQTATLAMAAEPELLGCKVADLERALADMIHSYLFSTPPRPADAPPPAKTAKASSVKAKKKTARDKRS